MTDDILLRVENLKKYFKVKGTRGPGVQAVEDVSLFIRRGETLGLVGESGCCTSPPPAALPTATR